MILGKSAQPHYSYMKKTIKKLLLVIPLLFSISACDNTDNVSFDKEIKIDTKDLGFEGCGELGPFNVNFNLEDYATVEDQPNINKAKIALLFGANICAHSKVLFPDTNPNSEIDDFALFNQLGLEEQKEYYTNVPNDDSDVAHVEMGHHFVKKDGKKYDIVFCSIRDSSFGNSWISNLDIGYDDASYYEKTGNHPEWTDKENHKGFDVSTNRVMGFIEQYISGIKSEKTQQILYLFGHSRGGAISNLVAKKMIDKGHEVVAYNMGSPFTTTSSDTSNSKYSHIYNYVNQVDAITSIPSAQWGFKRYGTDIRFDVRNYKEQFKQYTGQDLPEYGEESVIVKLLSSLCDSRDKIYVIDEKFTLETSKPFDTQEKVDNYIQKYKDKFEEGFTHLQRHLRFDVTKNSDDKFVVSVVSCPGLLSDLIGAGIARYSLNYAFQTLALQYYSILSFYAKFAGIDNIMSLRDTIDSKALAFAHFFQSYVAYFNA